MNHKLPSLPTPPTSDVPTSHSGKSRSKEHEEAYQKLTEAQGYAARADILLKQLPTSIRTDHVFLSIVIHNLIPRVARLMPPGFFKDKNFVLEHAPWMSIKSLSPDLQDDKETVIAIINYPDNATEFVHIRDQFKDDPEIVEVGIRNNWILYTQASERLRQQPAILLLSIDHPLVDFNNWVLDVWAKIPLSLQKRLETGMSFNSLDSEILLGHKVTQAKIINTLKIIVAEDIHASLKAQKQQNAPKTSHTSGYRSKSRI